MIEHNFFSLRPASSHVAMLNPFTHNCSFTVLGWETLLQLCFLSSKQRVNSTFKAKDRLGSLKYLKYRQKWCKNLIRNFPVVITRISKCWEKPGVLHQTDFRRQWTGRRVCWGGRSAWFLQMQLLECTLLPWKWGIKMRIQLKPKWISYPTLRNFTKWRSLNSWMWNHHTIKIWNK